MLSQLKTQQNRLHRVITLIDDKDPLVEYRVNGDEELYTIHRPQAFTEWISSLMIPNPSTSITTVIIVHRDFETTIQHLRTIHNFAADQSVDGDACLPLRCNLYLVIDQRSLEPDLLSPQSVGTQQFLRLMAMEHAALVVVVDDVDRRVVARADTLLTSLNRLTEPKPILEVVGDSWETNMATKDKGDVPPYVSLYIPKAWDSINRVLLLAKLVLYLNNDQYLLTLELGCHQFVSTYRTLFTSGADADNLSTVLANIGYPSPPKPPKATPLEPMTIDQIYQELGANYDVI